MSNASRAAAETSTERPPVFGRFLPSGIVLRITLSLGEVLSPVVVRVCVSVVPVVVPAVGLAVGLAVGFAVGLAVELVPVVPVVFVVPVVVVPVVPVVVVAQSSTLRVHSTSAEMICIKYCPGSLFTFLTPLLSPLTSTGFGSSAWPRSFLMKKPRIPPRPTDGGAVFTLSYTTRHCGPTIVKKGVSVLVSPLPVKVSTNLQPPLSAIGAVIVPVVVPVVPVVLVLVVVPVVPVVVVVVVVCPHAGNVNTKRKVRVANITRKYGT
jgi:hypothetical protein